MSRAVVGEVFPRGEERVLAAAGSAQGSDGQGAVLAAHAIGKFYGTAVRRVRPLLRAYQGSEGRLPAAGRWALRGVDFSLEEGGSLGVVGRNGAGKSTLLRLLAGTSLPSEGQVWRGAAVGCLLDLGIGFDPHETGRQNALSMLALSCPGGRREASERLAEVAEFSGLGANLDRPVKTYSDGMRLRLAFASATAHRPRVLVTDEVLVVGDGAFQRRCEHWLERFLGDGGTLVLCSHDLVQIKRLCARGLWLEDGLVRASGAVNGVIGAYRESIATGGGTAGITHAAGRLTGLPFEISHLRIVGSDGLEVEQLATGEALFAEIELQADAGVPNVFVGVTTIDLTPVYGVASDMDGAVPEPIGPGRWRFRLHFEALRLEPGTYRLRAHALDETATRLYDTVERRFTIAPRKAASGKDCGFASFAGGFVPAAPPSLSPGLSSEEG